MVNVIVGILLVVAGASGKFTLIGTRSPFLLIALGVGIASLGVFQMIRGRTRR